MLFYWESDLLCRSLEDSGNGIRGLRECRGFVGDDCLGLALDEGAGDGDGISQLVRGKLVHQLHHELLHDGAKSAGARVTGQCLLCNRFESLILKDQSHVIQAEELHVLLDNGVLGLTEDADEGIAIQIVEGNDDG